MRLSDFDYTLPKELIAQYPLQVRDSARLLVLDRKHKRIHHRLFKDLTDYLAEGDLLAMNNTKVLPSRLKGARLSGGKVEVLLLKSKDGATYDALIKPSRIRLNEKIIFDHGKISAQLTGRNELTFNTEDKDAIYGLGAMPLPPYIKRNPQELDNIYYQTVYAQEAGSVAAPTAGLHFTEELIKKIQSSGINTVYVTLHVGYATFRPVKSENILEHKMEPEYFKIAPAVLRSIEKTKSQKKRIFAVGTTSCRVLESVTFGIKEGYTDLFIYPGYQFKMVDCLLTNFHLPRTTLFMLACAFGGEELMKKAYAEAIEKQYRFYSYGDAMLII